MKYSDVTAEAIVETLAALGTNRKVTRVRRGQLIAIPEQWRGKVSHRQTIRKRPSKSLHKHRKAIKLGHERLPRPAERWAECEVLKVSE